MATQPTQTSELLRRLNDGDGSAATKLFPLIYDELRRLAQRYMNAEHGVHTLQPTALVHEAYMKLMGKNRPRGETRAHFFRIAAKAMREVLIDQARARKAEKRRAGGKPVDLAEVAAVFGPRAPHLIVIDEALEQLTQTDPQLGKLVELRFFGGLTNEQTSQILGCSLRSVERGWRVAKAWLRTRLTPSERSDK